MFLCLTLLWCRPPCHRTILQNDIKKDLELYESTDISKDSDGQDCEESRPFLKGSLSEEESVKPNKLKISCDLKQQQTLTARLKESKFIISKLLRNPDFILLSFCMFVYNSSTTMFIASLMIANGLTAMEAASIISLSSMSSLIGRIMGGVIYDLQKTTRVRVILFIVTCQCNSIITCILPVFRSYGGFAVMWGLYMFLLGNTKSHIPNLIVDVHERKMLPDALGMLDIVIAVGIVVGMLIAG